MAQARYLNASGIGPHKHWRIIHPHLARCHGNMLDRCHFHLAGKHSYFRLLRTIDAILGAVYPHWRFPMAAAVCGATRRAPGIYSGEGREKNNLRQWPVYRIDLYCSHLPHLASYLRAKGVYPRSEMVARSVERYSVAQPQFLPDGGHRRTLIPVWLAWHTSFAIRSRTLPCLSRTLPGAGHHDSRDCPASGAGKRRRFFVLLRHNAPSARTDLSLPITGCACSGARDLYTPHTPGRIAGQRCCARTRYRRIDRLDRCCPAVSDLAGGRYSQPYYFEGYTGGAGPAGNRLSMVDHSFRGSCYSHYHSFLLAGYVVVLTFSQQVPHYSPGHGSRNA